MVGIDPTIVRDLRQNGLLREGHFAFRSGRHSAGLVDRDLLLADPGFASHLGYVIAKKYFSDHIETVAAASVWGAGLAQWVGYFMEPRAKVVYATPQNGKMGLAPVLHETIVKRRVLLVDNFVLTGATIKTFAETVDALGAEVIGIATLWNSGERTIAGHPVFGLLNSLYEAWEPGDCPICAAGGPAPEQVPY